MTCTGYVPRDASIITCQANDLWTPDPNGLACAEAVALIIGGKLEGGAIGKSRAEVYAPDAHMALPNFEGGSWGQAVFYREGKVVVCGGCTETISCLEGEYQKEKRGQFCKFCSQSLTIPNQKGHTATPINLQFIGQTTAYKCIYKYIYIYINVYIYIYVYI